MAMTPLLISKADFVGIIDVSANIDEVKKLNPQIQQAQDFDLRGLMGDKMYYAMIKNWQDNSNTFTAPWNTLFTGGSYTVDGVTYMFEGLKPVLVYFAGARLVRNLDLHITPNAIMAKRNDFSDPVDLKEKIFRGVNFENSANAYWHMTVGYLNANASLFPYWNTGCGCEAKENYKPKTVAVGHAEEYTYGRSIYNRRR